MDLGDILPTSGLPRTDYPASQKVKWLGDDTLEKYKLRGGHPLYDENDIIYSFNSLGYRCPEFDLVASIRIVAIGCSYVLGVGLPQRAVFHELFAEKLRAMVTPRSVVVWNLGWGGASNDYISRMLYFAVPTLNPHIVLINFTHFSRREYISVQNRYVKYNSSSSPSDKITKDIFRHFAALSSPFDDRLNFIRNYKAIECLLTGRQWLYSYIKAEEPEPVAGLLDLRRCVGSLQIVDRARDNGHPGPESHRRVAELYWAKFIDRGGLENPACSPANSNRNMQ
jgi:hypothetical protein